MNTLITQSWNKYLDTFDDINKDIYYYEEYVKLYETKIGSALCIVCYENEKVLLMPFIRKEYENYFDFETPYGYGGPIANTDNNAWISDALKAMEEFFKNEGYICGFVRFHPLLNNSDICKNSFQVLFDRNTVAIDTSADIEEIWNQQIISKNRNMIRKAQKNGLTFTAEYNFDSMDEFINLYLSTMERLNADDFYFFDKEYFKKYLKNFAGHSFLGTVRKDNELICAALFMYSENYGHYHLEGSNHNFSSLGANNLLLWETAKEFHKLGIKYFHLGGGYNSQPDNSLLKFKKSFCHNLFDFNIGKWVFNKTEYQRIKSKWMEMYPEKVKQFGNLLLCYRY